MLARNLGCRLIRTSVKEDVNVSSVFRYLATKCHQLIKHQYSTSLCQPMGQPTISAFSPTFAKTNGTIILRPVKKASMKKTMMKKCRIL